MVGFIDNVNVTSNINLNEVSDVENTKNIVPTIKASIEAINDLLSKANLLGVSGEKPSLEAPKTNNMSVKSILSLSEDAIMTMLGFENSKTNIKSAQSSLKTNALIRKQQNEELISKLQEQAKKIDEESKLSPLKKLFKIIGAVLGVAIGIASCIATGGATAAVVGLVIGSLLAADTVVSTATDGKVGLGAACSKIFGEKAGPWVAFGLQLALAVASIGCAIGSASSAANAASSAADTATKLQSTASSVSKGLAIFSSLNTIASSGMDINSALNQKDIAFLKADQKVIQALMNDLMAVDERTIRRLQEVLENSQSNVSKVKDIVDELNETTTATVTA